MVTGRERIGSALLGAASVCPGDYELWNVTGCSCLSHSVGWKEQGQPDDWRLELHEIMFQTTKTAGRGGTGL